jgi:2-polyprenyl-3-methyl-5-hydroxy-6-metoxy-1,4-benzoquinol methylase
MTVDFYDELSPLYTLVYADWEASVVRQAGELDAVIRELWGARVREVLDAACGVGTQALGLAGLGYEVTGSDLSPESVRRARREAESRGLRIAFSVADMRQLFAQHQRAFDLVIACDNAVPHLLSDAEILAAFREMYRCTRPAGGCIISVRDYAATELGGTRVIPYGVRHEGSVCELMVEAGYTAVRRLDGRFFQPLVVGERVA